jgi:hypothetical protein
MKKLLTFAFAAILAASFSVAGYAQEPKPAGGEDQAAMSAPEKQHQHHMKHKKHHKKHHKAHKKHHMMKEEAATPAAEPAPAK